MASECCVLVVEDDVMRVRFHTGEESCIPLDVALASHTLNNVAAESTTEEEVVMRFPAGLLQSWLKIAVESPETFTSLPTDVLVNCLKVYFLICACGFALS